MGVPSSPLPPPEPPAPGECCGRGCERCVWVYYEEALERWRQRVARIETDAPSLTETG
ncbi:MAG: oxidoreductase-like domain-containing protein [Chromatiales bacterium]